MISQYKDLHVNAEFSSEVKFTENALRASPLTSALSFHYFIYSRTALKSHFIDTSPFSCRATNSHDFQVEKFYPMYSVAKVRTVLFKNRTDDKNSTKIDRASECFQQSNI